MKRSALLLVLAMQPVFAAEEPVSVKSTFDDWGYNIQRLNRAEVIGDTLHIEGTVFTSGSGGGRLQESPEDLTLSIVPRIMPASLGFGGPIQELDLALGMPEKWDEKKINNFGRIVLTSAYLFGFKAQFKLPKLKKDQTWKFLFDSAYDRQDFFELAWSVQQKKWRLIYGPLEARNIKELKNYTVSQFVVPNWTLSPEKIEQESKEKGKVSLAITGKFLPQQCAQAKKTVDLALDIDKTRIKTAGGASLYFLSFFKSEGKTLDPLGVTCQSDEPEAAFDIAMDLSSSRYVYEGVEPFMVSYSYNVIFPIKGQQERKIGRRQLMMSFDKDAWKLQTHDAFAMDHPLDQ